MNGKMGRFLTNRTGDGQGFRNSNLIFGQCFFLTAADFHSNDNAPDGELLVFVYRQHVLDWCACQIQTHKGSVQYKWYDGIFDNEFFYILFFGDILGNVPTKHLKIANPSDPYLNVVLVTSYFLFIINYFNHFTKK